MRQDRGTHGCIGSRRDEFLGRTIEFAGDELTEAQVAETFSRVIGRPVKIATPQMPEGQAPSPEQMAMFQFFSGKGYDADIAALRKIYPGLRKFETYLRQTGWENLPVLPVPKDASTWRR